VFNAAEKSTLADYAKANR